MFLSIILPLHASVAIISVYWTLIIGQDLIPQLKEIYSSTFVSESLFYITISGIYSSSNIPLLLVVKDSLILKLIIIILISEPYSSYGKIFPLLNERVIVNPCVVVIKYDTSIIISIIGTDKSFIAIAGFVFFDVDRIVIRILGGGNNFALAEKDQVRLSLRKYSLVNESHTRIS